MNDVSFPIPTFGETNNHEVTGVYEFPEDKTITKVDMWYSADDKDIESMQFYD